MEMDLGELGKVGRASLLVATVGVVAPLVARPRRHAADRRRLQHRRSSSAPRSTATSVGITARVFGDLRALATTEARIVLGAAVADDVMGLVVLTVVVRLVTEGSVSVCRVARDRRSSRSRFLVVGGARRRCGVAPPLFALVERVSRSTGHAGRARARLHARVRRARRRRQAGPDRRRLRRRARARPQTDSPTASARELAPVGHLFIPVFFLQIGIDADIDAFGQLERAARRRDPPGRRRRREAASSPLGAIGSPGRQAAHRARHAAPRRGRADLRHDRARQRRARATTSTPRCCSSCSPRRCVTPQLLKVRFGHDPVARSRARRRAARHVEPPQGGWLRVVDGEVRLDRDAATRAVAAASRSTPRSRWPTPRRRRSCSTTSASVPSRTGWDDRASAALRRRGRARQPPVVAVPRDRRRARPDALPEVAEHPAGPLRRSVRARRDAHPPLGHARTTPVAPRGPGDPCAAVRTPRTPRVAASGGAAGGRARGERAPARRTRRTSSSASGTARSPRQRSSVWSATTASCGRRRSASMPSTRRRCSSSRRTSTRRERARATYVLAVAREDGSRGRGPRAAGVPPRVAAAGAVRPGPHRSGGPQPGRAAPHRGDAHRPGAARRRGADPSRAARRTSHGSSRRRSSGTPRSSSRRR